MQGQAQQQRLQWMDAPAEPEIAGMPLRLRLARDQPWAAGLDSSTALSESASVAAAAG